MVDICYKPKYSKTKKKKNRNRIDITPLLDYSLRDYSCTKNVKYKGR